MPVAEAIRDWSDGRPMWQRDALRRLAAAPGLTEEDLDELVALCKEQHGIACDPLVIARPVEMSDLPTDGATEPAVRLLEILDVENVNALASDSRLAVSDQGLTVVFGVNGAGKSGYVRILKHVCRARGEARPVLGNVYDSAAEGPASATLRYAGGDEEREYRWEQGGQPPDELRAISIFDHACASVYTDERCDVAYLPFGLDLLPRLADACRAVRRRLEGEVRALQDVSVQLPELPDGTEALGLLGRLDEHGIEDELERFARFSEDERGRLEELTARFGEGDPLRRASEIEGQSRRLDRLSESLGGWIRDLSDASLERLREMLRTWGGARDAVRIAREEAFVAAPITGTGTDPWRALWEAARSFAEEVASVDSTFPPVEGMPCLLCQTAVDSSAARRMAEFETFVQGALTSQIGVVPSPRTGFGLRLKRPRRASFRS